MSKRPFTECSNKRKDLDDLYITPESCILPLLKIEKFEGKGWEPASGTGAIAKHFPGIMASDIKTDDFVYGYKGIDFLWKVHTPREEVDFIVTNPPFKLALAFLKQSLAFSRFKVALFLRIQFMTGKERVEFLRKNPPIRIHVFVGRPSCLNLEGKTLGTGMNFAWFIWEKGFKGKPTIDWLDEEV
jgi:hypothetical protein